MNDLEGFVKLSNTVDRLKISSEDRVKLIRIGNDLFKSKEYDKSLKIFLNVNYTDGIIRIAEYYEGQNNYLTALQLYKISKSHKKYDSLIEKIAMVVRNLMLEKKGK